MCLFHFLKGVTDGLKDCSKVAAKFPVKISSKGTSKGYCSENGAPLPMHHCKMEAGNRHTRGETV
jgi:hypothetical protein